MIYNYIYRVTHSFLDFDASYTPIIHQETIASSVHPQYQTPTSETLVQYWILSCLRSIWIAFNILQLVTTCLVILLF